LLQKVPAVIITRVYSFYMLAQRYFYHITNLVFNEYNHYQSLYFTQV